MPEPFKNLFNKAMLAQMAKHLSRASKSFDGKRFLRVASSGLDQLELKARSSQITDALAEALPNDFLSARDTLIGSLHPDTEEDVSVKEMDGRGIRGWGVMPMCDFVSRHGMGEFDASMDALSEMTKRFSAEFAVRDFLIEDEARALRHFTKWTKDRNVHVRRLASEGSRPRLPWGVQLRSFVQDPAPLFPILEALRDDEDEYVRRSVANNLNDIAKDHPALIAKLAKDWLRGASADRSRLVRHACRTLVKRGDQATLRALGYGPAKVKVENVAASPVAVREGDSVQLELTLRSAAKTAQSLIVDYVIHHQKARGKTSPKVFKWKTFELPPGKTVDLAKKHSFKRVTTRTYYPGTHRIEITVNGTPVGSTSCELSL